MLLCFRSVLNGSTEAGNRVAAILMVGLAVVVLAGRVAVGVLPEAGIQQTRAYLYLDPVRNHNCWSILVDYYTANGDSTLAIGTHAEKFAFLPEESTLVVSRRLLERGETEQGLTALLRVKGRYGGVGAYHSQLGTALLKLGRTSEAFDELRIAQEMNPYDPIVRTNLGSIHFLRGDTARAENYWRRALSIDPTSIMSLYGLAVAARARGETEALMEIFDQGESLPHMQADFYRLMAEVTSSRGDYERAARAIRIGLERGLDSAFVKAIRARHPALGSP